MEIWQRKWWQLVMAFNAGEAFELLWITNDLARFAIFVIAIVLASLIAWGVWWVYTHLEIKRKA